MAPQAPNLPWKVLSDNFEYHHKWKLYKNETNLFPKQDAAIWDALKHISTTFAQTMDEHTKIERTKYADKYEPPKDDEEVFSSELAARIRKTLKQCDEDKSATCEGKHSRLTTLEDRKMSSWAKLLDNLNPEDMLSPLILEPLKILILHDEMEPVLRIMEHPLVSFWSAWEHHWRASDDYGLKPMIYITLISYICLNILLQKPELYDPDTKKRCFESPPTEPGCQVSTESDVDYRLTRGYQMVLAYTGEVERNETLPHREVYGFLSDSSKTYSFKKLAGFDDLSTLKYIANGDTSYRPHPDDVAHAIWVLRRKGLPAELCLEILDLAGYTIKRRVTVMDDPLHKDNADELQKYLAYCWRLLARCNMLVEFQKERINWEWSVARCIWKLFGRPLRNGDSFPDLGYNEVDLDLEADDSDDSAILPFV